MVEVAMTTLLSPHLPPVTSPIRTLEDWWIAALDGRMVGLHDRVYAVTIVGIHRGEAGDVWLQLAPFEQVDREMQRADRGITLHCPATAAPHDALHALRDHLV